MNPRKKVKLQACLNVINPSWLQFWHMQARCQILKSRQEHIFFHLGKWKMIVSVKTSSGKTSLFERNTILSHLPGTLKVFWWLTYPFLFNNITLFISCGSAQLACYWRNMQVGCHRVKCWISPAACAQWQPCPTNKNRNLKEKQKLQCSKKEPSTRLFFT